MLYICDQIVTKCDHFEEIRKIDRVTKAQAYGFFIDCSGQSSIQNYDQTLFSLYSDSEFSSSHVLWFSTYQRYHQYLIASFIVSLKLKVDDLSPISNNIKIMSIYSKKDIIFYFKCNFLNLTIESYFYD